MEYGFFDLLELVGSLGLFLYGMKLMSEALQKSAGNKLRSIMAAMTSNRVMGVMTGFLVTAIIQSSSATTVMLVSFVNAGLMSLVQSISVIMGANIGTTVTAWIISVFGFKVSISDFSIPIIAIAFPLIFSKRNSRKNWGEFLIGFALLFMGLDLLKHSVPDVKHNPEILQFLASYTDLGYLSIILFLFIGSLLTIVVQSSSATMAITLIMCAQGWITYEIAAAMVLGENIGTTITANLAALSANISAKRAALAHTVFNVFGVLWMLIVFYPFTSMIQSIVLSSGATETAQVDAFSLSLFHTFFNVSNVLILGWFANPIANLVTKIIKQKNTDEEFRLTHISTGMLSTSELSVLQVQKEIYVYAERVQKMFGIVKEYYAEKNHSQQTKMFTRITKYENISDRMELEIAAYLTKLTDGKLSNESKIKIHKMLRIISEIESVADSCYNLAKVIERGRNEKVDFTVELDANLAQMYTLLDDAMINMLDILSRIDEGDVDISTSENIENEINYQRNQFKLNNVTDVKNNVYQYNTSVIYMDMVVECEKMGDYIINIVEVVVEGN